jgi:hypothetical protein
MAYIPTEPKLLQLRIIILTSDKRISAGRAVEAEATRYLAVFQLAPLTLHTLLYLN